MANFGPIDTSVLYGQANHRSEDVLGDPDTTLTEILQCGHIEIDTHLITALVERWRPEHTFHFSVGEATITLQDISIIWAIPIEGNLITGVDIKWTTQQWQNYCHQWLGFRPNEDAFKRSRIKLSALLDWLLNNTCDDESHSMLYYKRHAFVLCALLVGYCVPMLQLLQIWAWSRIITLAPIPSNNAADLMPTVIDVENILPIPLYAARRGRHGEDWASFHRDYIVKWNDVQSMLVVRPEIVNGRGTVPDYMNWYHQITRVQISHNIGSTDITGYRPTDTRDWEYVYNRMEQLVLDCDNSGDDIQSLRETRARNRAIGRDIMTFSSARYPSVRRGPASDDAGPSNVYNEAGPSNVYNEAGPSNVYNEAGPSNVYNEAGPSNFFTPTGPSYAYTSNMPFSSGDFAHNIHPETRRHLGISPVPFDGSDVNTPIEEPQDITDDIHVVALGDITSLVEYCYVLNM
ncbi:UNVERIFIED_CONTAM: Serine/threonine-protein phosphatase 7 long form [Sesamum radiatum]|uniref:Serine/threonine-protein phosphatase 7 long form n=1 Tax=Sesamum radiatum TaxID=300843 RepID=A0AAW2P537_SESRA